ncbi:MAG: hypothetical protein DHS20C18_45330 [Saprospiraceae bacterium]|nr:MAG: hypothetical protein DHS20C18_45330 [Saprospiraceae bacterium]
MKKVITFLVFIALSFHLSAQATVEGYIHYCNGTPLEGVSVGPVVTDENGFYSFEIEAGSDYVVEPSFDQYPMAGVDYNDLFLMRLMIFGYVDISPYQVIAGDLNGSFGISTYDLVLLSKLILGELTLDQFDPFWIFVLSDYVFPNPTNPWDEGFPQQSIITQAEDGNTYTVNFTAVKLGDVDCSFNAENLAGVNGQIFYDENENCTNDFEEALSGFRLRLVGDNYTYYTNSYSNGYFSVYLTPGTYVPEILFPNNYWATCSGMESITIEQGEFVDLNIPIQATSICPHLEVDLATSLLRRCITNTYTVNYQNTGTIAAEDAYVTVELDEYLTLENSSILWTSVEGNTYTFPIGDVPRGESGFFTLEVLVSCEVELGQTHCSEAHIYPDDPCGSLNPEWDGSSLIVDGSCDGDSVHFLITNIGEEMQSGVNYIVIEDDLIMYEGILGPLNTAGTQEISMEANGSTFRVEFHQTASHPGENRPGLSLEGCGTNSEGTFSTGYVVVFAENDADPFVSIDCRENVDSYDPNDKQAFPGGVGENHQIEANQDIEYLIRFQNTGTAEAINVIVRDTLSPLLDPGSVQLGARSHDFEFRLTDQGVLNFYFPSIMLPDSNANEPASHGFVKFRVKQQPDLPIGTQIENSAAIYFDYNEPVITNIAFHTIGEDRLEILTGLETPSMPQRAITVAPNPAKDWLFFDLKDSTVSKGMIEFISSDGKLLLQKDFDANRFSINTKELPSGLCFYRILVPGGLWYGGKVIVD